MRERPSPVTDITMARWKKEMADAANANIRVLQGQGIEGVQRIVDEHELVFAIWGDRLETHGIGFSVLKGQSHLRMIVADNAPVAVSMTAIPCRSPEEAMALRMVLGEADLGRPDPN